MVITSLGKPHCRARPGSLTAHRASNGTPYPQFATYLPSAGASTPAWGTSSIPPNNYPPWSGTAGVTPTPAGSFGLPSPASFGPTTPMSPYTPLSYVTPSVSGQPIMATPYFNSARPGGGGGGGGGGALGLTASPMLDAYGYPLSRTPSAGRRKKKRSLGGGILGKSFSAGSRSDYQLWSGPEVYSIKNLARRPRDWRPDYNPRSRIASIMTLGKHRSDVPGAYIRPSLSVPSPTLTLTHADYTDPVKRSLSALISYKPGEPSMYWNLRYPPQPEEIEFTKLNNRRYNDIDMVQLATSPPADQLRLYHPRLPWYIDVFKTAPNGITVKDVLWAISHQLSSQIHQRHYYNEELDDAHRGVLSAAFSDRCSDTRVEREKGILQVDFLADKYVLLGLVKGKNGMWELKTGEED